MPRRRRGLERRIARERMKLLFALAEEEGLRGRKARADRYAHRARRIGMRYNVPLPKPLRLRLCRRCGSLLLPGRTASVRLRPTRLVITCRVCGRVYRHPFVREAKARRAASTP